VFNAGGIPGLQDGGAILAPAVGKFAKTKSAKIVDYMVCLPQ
jgi:hypothetical protein